MSTVGQSTETESRVVVARGWEGAEMGNDSIGFLFEVEENVLELVVRVA